MKGTKENLKYVFSRTLMGEAEKDDRVVVVDPEVGRSTDMLAFRQKFPKRFVECGIAEQDAIGIAAGLATEGMKPFVVAFSPFLTMRPIEITRCSVFHGGANVKLVAEYAGFTDGKDGPTHTSMEDIGMIRAIPNSVIVSPSDPIMTRKIAKWAISYCKPAYIRIETDDMEEIYEESVEFELGRSYILKSGKDITIVAYGSATNRAKEAASQLKELGIDAEVIDSVSIKPFDSETLLKSVIKTERLITVEDHNVYGGLATVACETIAKNMVKVEMINLAIQDIFTESGNASRLREKYGTSVKCIVKAAEELCNKGEKV